MANCKSFENYSRTIPSLKEHSSSLHKAIKCIMKQDMHEDADLRQMMEDLRQLMRHIRQVGQQVRQIKNKRRKDRQKSPLVQATMQTMDNSQLFPYPDWHGGGEIQQRQQPLHSTPTPDLSTAFDFSAPPLECDAIFPRGFIPGRVTVHSVRYFTGFSVSPPSPRSHRSTRTTGAAALGCPHFQPSTAPGSTAVCWIRLF
ncbi:hypothetical protein C8R45DRAFT_1081288 [Mycena sanguinolenta]|nr:hypothetical protein C8R45DRAFT_1081288 [Mycena sanguinolenta]